MEGDIGAVAGILTVETGSRRFLGDAAPSLYDSSLEQLLGDKLIKLLLLFLLLIELLSLSFLFLGADGLHIVRPFVNNGEIVGFAVLDMASIASYNQAIVLVEDNTSNLRLFRLDHWPLIIDLEPVNLVNLDHLDDALLLVVFSTFTLRSVVIEVLAGDKDQ